MRKTIIFTDLDGTLLDETSYSYAEALPALNLIATNHTPLILCSSKTRAELEMYRMQLNNTHPFISENGGGIFIPRGYFSIPVEAKEANGYQLIQLGTPYAQIRKHFVHLREKLHAKVWGFSDMSIAEVAALTGLHENEAALSMQRDFDEAFVFEAGTDEDFLHAIEAAGLHWTQGRIFHIMGKHDKGRAVSILMTLYQQQYGNVDSIALGDSLNDLPMLKAVDDPVLVKHKNGSYDSRITIPNLLKTRLPGPVGWNETVLRLLRHQPDSPDPELVDQHILVGIFEAALAEVDPCLDKTHNGIIAGLRQALTAAQGKATQLGYTTKTISDTLQGETSDAAHFLAQAVRTQLAEMQPNERCCLLCGGETTVTVRGTGKDEGNQEFALTFAVEIEGLQGVTLLSAGIMVDGRTASTARALGIDPLHYLANNDSYAFFQQLDTVSGVCSHLKTGPTDTNVMNIQIILLNKKSPSMPTEQISQENTQR